MRLCHGFAAITVLSLCGSAALAQTSTTPDTNARMQRFEQRLSELETKYQADIQARDAEIARLRAQLQTQSSPATGPADQIEKTKQDILRDIETREPAPLTLRTPASFNPDIAVIGDFRGNVSTRNDNPARNRFDVGSFELDLRAAVDPRADAVAILPITREVDDPLFFDSATASGAVDTAIEIEEGYLFLHDFGVPNLTAKLGRYHLNFGRWNQFHAHNWPTVDNAFVIQSFLGPEAVIDSGLSLSYVIPPKLLNNEYVEVTAEIIAGEGGDELPVLNSDASVDSPALNTHVKWNHDLARDWNIELGGSWLTSKHNNDNQQTANVFGSDITLIHIDPTGRFNNQLFQAEVLYGDVDTSRSETQHAWGAYLWAQQQLNRDWYVGCRLDWTENAVDDTQEVWGVSPFATWYLSEFLRLRAEYQHKQGDAPSEDILYFQVNWVFGAHPPHPYWAMR